METLINTTVTPKTVVYRYTLTLGPCTNTQNVTVRINPKPHMKPGLGDQLCPGEQAFLLLKTMPAFGSNVTYAWAPPTLDPGLTYYDNGTGTFFIMDDYTNSSNSVLNAVYSVTPTAVASIGGCVGDPANVTISVNPVITVDAGLVQTICSGTAANRSLSASTTGVTYTGCNRWYYRRYFTLCCQQCEYYRRSDQSDECPANSNLSCNSMVKWLFRSCC
jgi:hypothetical protein